MQMNNISVDHLLLHTRSFKGEPDAKCLVEAHESDLTSDQRSKSFYILPIDLPVSGTHK